MTTRAAASRTQRLSQTVIAAADTAKILGVKAGRSSDHRFTGVWPIVVEGRLFARSWTVTPGGWFATLAADPRLGRAEAFRRAMLEPIARGEPPSYWAPFVIVGEGGGGKLTGFGEFHRLRSGAAGGFVEDRLDLILEPLLSSERKALLVAGLR